MNGDGCIDLVRGAYGNNGNFPAEATNEWTAPWGGGSDFNQGRWLTGKLGEVMLNDCNGNFGTDTGHENNPMGLTSSYPGRPVRTPRRGLQGFTRSSPSTDHSPDLDRQPV